MLPANDCFLRALQENSVARHEFCAILLRAPPRKLCGPLTIFYLLFALQNIPWGGKFFGGRIESFGALFQ